MSSGRIRVRTVAEACLRSYGESCLVEFRGPPRPMPVVGDDNVRVCGSGSGLQGGRAGGKLAAVMHGDLNLHHIRPCRDYLYLQSSRSPPGASPPTPRDHVVVLVYRPSPHPPPPP